MFYMEHGAGASNLEMRFNLPVIEKGRFTVEKVLAGTNQQKYSNVYFAYQAFKKKSFLQKCDKSGDGRIDIDLGRSILLTKPGSCA